MPFIRPISDLRNNFTDISKEVHETNEPIFLTKNGYGDMVVMSLDSFEKLKFENDIYFKLKEAEFESELTSKRYSHDDVFNHLKKDLKDKVKWFMYKLSYLHIAKKDIENIILYISNTLKSPTAALHLLDSFESALEILKDFPYSHEIYKLSNRLNKEYRYITVKNYVIFYTVLENEKIVEIQRVLYGKMDFNKII